MSEVSERIREAMRLTAEVDRLEDLYLKAKDEKAAYLLKVCGVAVGDIIRAQNDTLKVTMVNPTYMRVDPKSATGFSRPGIYAVKKRANGEWSKRMLHPYDWVLVEPKGQVNEVA